MMRTWKTKEEDGRTLYLCRCDACGQEGKNYTPHDCARWHCKCKNKSTKTPCLHMGESTRETVECRSCQGNIRLKLFHCAIHGQCTTHKQVEGVPCCLTCGQYEPWKEPTDGQSC